ncbi:Epoxide hydrolase [Gryllus bimaculatus]|nr:Epoxide hydrolase [Gryllus bimaculatus]
MGVLFRALMERLGHKEFYVQGGDWGHVIGSAMATLFPKSVLGFHTNMVFLTTPLSQFRLLLGSFIPSLVVEPEHYNKVYPIAKNFMYILEESGYFHLQTTKPDTVGVSLRDSAVGLAAYILEKFSTWTDKDWRSLPDGNLEKKYSLTNLLDNVMIYWVSGSITTSMRLYSEAFTKQYLGLQIDSVPCIVPTAVANFPNELSYTPKKIAEDKYRNLVQFSHLPRGGHFAAFEEPQLLANDLWDAVENIRKIRSQSLSKVKK